MDKKTSNMNSLPKFTLELNLASECLGAQALYASDDFFAPKENLVKDSKPIFIDGKYTEFGKWMDGWESRRKRGIDKNSHDHCILKLGAPGPILGIDVDTRFFTGNYPQDCSIEASNSENIGGVNNWTQILPRKPLKGDKSNFFSIASKDTWTYLKLNIYPDGGVARLRVYGIAKPDWKKLAGPVDLASALYGARVVQCNDMFYGDKNNIIMPGRAKVMGEGWETKRKRGIDNESHDWLIVMLGHVGKIQKIEVDTNHYKGNFPESCEIEGANGKEVSKLKWKRLLKRTKLQGHHQHYFEAEIEDAAKKTEFTHLRLKIFPDGGISRFRAWGHI